MMNDHRRRTEILGAVVMALVATSCTQRPDLTAEQAAIRTIDNQMVVALNARELDRWLTFVADDASMMPPNGAAVVGKEAIRAMLSELMAIPTFSVIHHPGAVEVSRSADMAYVRYSYELTMKDANGVAVTEKGKDVSIFRKQAGGSWKLLIDMWSSDTPLAMTPAGKN